VNYGIYVEVIMYKLIEQSSADCNLAGQPIATEEKLFSTSNLHSSAAPETAVNIQNINLVRMGAPLSSVVNSTSSMKPRRFLNHEHRFY
jgi:hypothetical protein